MFIGVTAFSVDLAISMGSTAGAQVMGMLLDEPEVLPAPQSAAEPSSRGLRRRTEQSAPPVARSAGPYNLTVTHALPRENVFKPVSTLYDAAVKQALQSYLDAYEKQYKLQITLDNLKQMKEKGEIPVSCRVPRLTVRFTSATPDLTAELDTKARELENFYLEKLITAAESDVAAATAAAAFATAQAKQLVTDVADQLPAEYKPLREVRQLANDAQLSLAWKLHLAKGKMQQLLQKQEEQKQKQAAAAAQAQAGALNMEAQVDQLVAKSLEKRMPPLQAQQQQQPAQQQATTPQQQKKNKRTQKKGKNKPSQPPAPNGNQQQPNQQQQGFRRGHQRR